MLCNYIVTLILVQVILYTLVHGIKTLILNKMMLIILPTSVYGFIVSFYNSLIFC